MSNIICTTISCKKHTKSVFFLKLRDTFLRNIRKKACPCTSKHHAHTRCYMKRAFARRHCFGVVTARSSAPIKRYRLLAREENVQSGKRELGKKFSKMYFVRCFSVVDRSTSFRRKDILPKEGYSSAKLRNRKRK